METLESQESGAALQIIDDLLRLAGVEGAERSALANAWLKSASIRYRKREFAKSLICATRAVLARPIVAGRPVKRAVARLATALKSSRGMSLLLLSTIDGWAGVTQ